MDHLLDFCRAILLLTGGFFVFVFWVSLITVLLIEGYDLIHDAYFTPTKKNEDDY